MGEKLFFKTSKGYKLCGILSEPISSQKNFIVVLCHGFTTDKNSTSNIMLEKILNENKISTFRFDFFGHGESEGKLSEITISIAVNDISSAIEFLKKLGYSKIGLIGSSFGGFASILTASKSNDLYILALKSPVSDLYELFILQGGKQLIKKWEEDKYIDYIARDGSNFRLNYSLLEEAKNLNAYQVAFKIKVPTLIVHGDHDESVPIYHSEKLASLIKKCELKIIEGADHGYSNPEHFEKMLSLISDFIIKNS